MPSFIDLTGQKFGRWTLIKRALDKGKQTAYLCECSCDAHIQRVVAANNLKTGKSESCGCLAAERAAEAHTTHGLAYHPAYKVWTCARARCHNPNDQKYRIYGARGIKMCEDWRKGFEAFWKDMGPSYEQGLTLDRIDTDGDYEPTNCRWVSMKVQANNKRRHRKIKTDAGIMNISQASSHSGLSYDTIWNRLESGWPEEDLLLPVETVRVRNRFGRFA